MKKISTIAALSLLAISQAQAADFAVLDANADGGLTFEEINTAMPEVTEDIFKTVDLNQDGYINEEEFAAAELK